MRITHQNYLLVQYSQFDWDKFYVDEMIEVKTEDFEICGRVHGFASQRMFLICDGDKLKYVWFDEITSIRKVDK